MIVASKRVYLNVLTQLWPADRLLMANYYIGDQKAVNGYSNINDQISLNEFGQVVTNNNVRESPTTFAGSYNIKMSTCLDPTPHKVEFLCGDGNVASGTPEERFINSHLNNPETFLTVYDFLFREPLMGNGLQILIFNDDQNVLQFGHIICQYLSMNFGVDILFIDAQYRAKCRGYVQYTGDKQTAAKTIKDIRDYQLVFNFNQAVSQSDFCGSINNIIEYLQAFDFNQTMYLYTLLYPEDPIPPGNYTIDHIREILIGRATAGMRKKENPLQNIFINNWQSVIDRMSREDYGSDDGVY